MRIMPNLTISKESYGPDTYMYVWNFSPSDLKKIALYRSVTFAHEYGWDMPLEADQELIDALVASDLKSSDLSMLYSYKNGELVNCFIFEASTNFDEASVRALNESAKVVEKLCTLL